MVDASRITFLVSWGREQRKADPEQLKAQQWWHVVNFF